MVLLLFLKANALQLESTHLVGEKGKTRFLWQISLEFSQIALPPVPCYSVC